MTAASFNKPAPPQFQGLDPGLPLTKCTRHLPRWRQPFFSSWAEEFCDRMIRDEEHLWNVIEYIANNPSRAGLNTSQCPTWIHPEWQSDGWDFVDT